MEKLPITLSQDNLPYFSTLNPPLSDALIRRFLLQGEAQPDLEDMTEFVPCCRIPETGKIHAVVYWKGMLLSYEFMLATFDANGVLLAKKVLAGIKSDGTKVKHAIATIDEDWVISIMSGVQSNESDLYDPANSFITSMELLANGEIIYSLQE